MKREGQISVRMNNNNNVDRISNSHDTRHSLHDSITPSAIYCSSLVGNTICVICFTIPTGDYESKKEFLTTMARPIIELGPDKEIIESLNLSSTHPFTSACTFPRSPTWRTLSEGAPWSKFFGLKCAPAEMHPLVVSPYTCTWKPCNPGASPVKLAVISTALSGVFNSRKRL